MGLVCGVDGRDGCCGVGEREKYSSNLRLEHKRGPLFDFEERPVEFQPMLLNKNGSTFGRIVESSQNYWRA